MHVFATISDAALCKVIKEVIDGKADVIGDSL